MPGLNFNLTFYQPWMAYLDAGNCGGPDSMSKTLTSLYVKTALTGIPGGGTLPPTLPAPGLNPLAPPPYPLPYIPINAYDSRQRRMEKVLKVYFQIKESLILNSSMKFVIKSIKAAIKNSIQLAKNIKETIFTAVELIRELVKLPEKLKVVVDLILEIVKEEGKQLKSIIENIRPARLGFNQDYFNEKFKNEIELYNLITNFKPSANIKDYFALGNVIDDIDKTLNSLPDIEDGSEEQQLKKFILGAIKQSIGKIVNWGSIFKDPVQAIGFVRSYAHVDRKFQPVLDVLEEFKTIKRLIYPQLQKLKRKIKEYIIKLTTRVKAYINDQKEKLKTLIKKKATKQDNPNAKVSFFTKAGKYIKTHKKTYVDKIKKIKKTFTNVTAIIKDIDYLVNKSKQIYANLKEFFNTSLTEHFEEALSFMKNKYEQYLQDSVNYNNATLDEKTNELIAANDTISVFLKQIGITLPFINDLVKSAVNKVKQDPKGKNRIPSIHVLTEFFEQSNGKVAAFLDEIVHFIDRILDIDKRVSEIITDWKSKEPNQKAKNQYVDDGTVYVLRAGISSPTTQGLMFGSTEMSNTTLVAPPIPLRPVLVRISDKFDNTIWSKDSQTPPPDSSFRDTAFYYYNNGDVKVGEGGDESKAATIKTTEHVENIDGQLYVMANKPVEITANKPRPIAEPEYKKKTLLDTIRIWLRQVRKFFVKLKNKLNNFIQAKKIEIGVLLNRLKDGVENMLISLVPVKASVKDKMNKKELIEFRKEKIKATKKKLKKIVKYITILSKKIIPSVVDILTSLVRGRDYRYSNHSKSINDLLDGYYEIKNEDASAEVKLQQEITKTKLKNDIRDYLGGAEALYDVFSALLRDIRDTEFFEKFANRMEQILINGEGKHNVKGYIDFYDKIKQLQALSKSSPDIKECFAFFQGSFQVDPTKVDISPIDPSFKVLENGYFKSVLAELERAYLKETMFYVTKVTENSLIKRMFPTKPGEKSLTEKSESVINILLKSITTILYGIYKWIIKIINTIVKPITDWIMKQKVKLQEDLEAFIKNHIVDRMKNFDLKLSAKAYNLATKVFWTGFKWKAPDSTEFRILSILDLPSVMFEGIQPEDGYSVSYLALSNQYEIQMRSNISGICIPPKNTGIPPFPFIGVS